jgi:hypothetical protein
LHRRRRRGIRDAFVVTPVRARDWPRRHSQRVASLGGTLAILSTGSRNGIAVPILLQAGTMLRILLADDHAVVPRGFALVLVSKGSPAVGTP